MSKGSSGWKDTQNVKESGEVHTQRNWGGGGGGAGGAQTPHFLTRWAEPPKIGGCHEERIKY